MSIEVSSAAAASVWELLCHSPVPMDAQTISRETGLPVARVSSILGKFNLAGLVDKVSSPAVAQPEPVAAVGRGRKVKQELPAAPAVGASFVARRDMDAMTYATAVEIGIPLFLLEKTVSLSRQNRKEAYRLAETGQVDQAREQARQRRREEIQSQIRGRAATRAAATDLAKLVYDVSRAIPVELPLDDEIKKALPAEVSATRTTLAESPALTKVRMEVARQAAQALEALVLALEKAR